MKTFREIILSLTKDDSAVNGSTWKDRILIECEGLDQKLKNKLRALACNHGVGFTSHGTHQHWNDMVYNQLGNSGKGRIFGSDSGRHSYPCYVSGAELLEALINQENTQSEPEPRKEHSTMLNSYHVVIIENVKNETNDAVTPEIRDSFVDLAATTQVVREKAIRKYSKIALEDLRIDIHRINN